MGESSFTAWTAWAERCERWRPPVGPVCVIAPHPDDETLGAGGLIFECRRRGQPVTVLSVTDGEASHAERPDLAAIRRRELLRAMQIIGGSALQIERLGLPDGDVHSKIATLRMALEALDRDVTLVAPYEHDGHPDHEAVGRACAEAAAARGMALARYVIWAWSGMSSKSLSALPARRLDLDAAGFRAKALALASFPSQLGTDLGAPIVPAAVLAYFQQPYEIFLTHRSATHER